MSYVPNGLRTGGAGKDYTPQLQSSSRSHPLCLDGLMYTTNI